MRVLFISDFTLQDNSGGAQVSNKIIIDKGRELGHDIKEHSYRSSATDFLSADSAPHSSTVIQKYI